MDNVCAVNIAPPVAAWQIVRPDGVARGHQPARRHLGRHGVARPQRLRPTRSRRPRARACCEAAADLGYPPSALAQALVTRSSRIIGVIVNDIVDPYFAEIARGVEDVAGRIGHLVMVCNADHRVEAEIEYVRALRDYHAEGLVFAGSGAPATGERRARARRRGRARAARASSRSRSATSRPARRGRQRGRRARRHRPPDLARPPPDRVRRRAAGALHERASGGRLPRRDGRRRTAEPTCVFPGGFDFEAGLAAGRRLLDPRGRCPTPSWAPTTRPRSAS